MKVKSYNILYLFTFVFIFILKNVRSDFSEFDILKSFDLLTTDNYFLGRPPGVNNSYSRPVIILVNSHLRQLEKIDDKNMEIQIQMTIRLSWLDPRIAERWSEITDGFSNLSYVTFRDARKIWIPNVLFTNKKKSLDDDDMTPNTYVRLFPNGSIILNRRSSQIFHCPMNFRQFPFDVQICSIQLTSYGDTMKQVQLFWNDNNSVQISTNFYAPNFGLENFLTMTKVSKTTTGEYSGVSIDLIFYRNIHFYLMKFYLPVIVIALISWLPFWLGRVLIIRIYIAFSSLIFLGWHYLAQPNDLITPHLTYLDYWRGINFVFVLSAASESIFISHMIKTNKNKITRNHPDDSEKFKMLQCKNCPEKKKYLEEVDEKTDLDLEVMKIKANFKIHFINVDKEVKIIDTVSRLFFPSAYCIFVFFYWLRCT